MNEEKCHLMILGNKHEHTFAKIGESRIWEENKIKALGITIDNRLDFNIHLEAICKKANQKLSAMIRIMNTLNQSQKRIIIKSFVESQFNYCPLVWMFHSRKINNKINRLHERALRMVYIDYNSSFEQLLAKDNSVSVHHRNIQKLAIEIYKVQNNLSNKINKGLF